MIIYTIEKFQVQKYPNIICDTKNKGMICNGDQDMRIYSNFGIFTQYFRLASLTFLSDHLSANYRYNFDKHKSLFDLQ